MRGIFFVPALLACAALAAEHTDRHFAVVGYLPEYRTAAVSFAHICNTTLTHVVFFSVEPTVDGALLGRDRVPSQHVLATARAACSHAALLLCIGGAGRSSSFAEALKRSSSRQRVVSALLELVEKHNLDGVDVNWEYPGYGRSGYAPAHEISSEYNDLAAFVRELKTALLASTQHRSRSYEVALAYYPDGVQEQQLAQRGLCTAGSGAADLCHAMAYDAPGGHHSPMALAQRVIDNARTAGMSLDRVTLGVPMYGRFVGSGEAMTWEEVITVLTDAQREETADVDTVLTFPGRGQLSCNGPAAIRAKLALAWTAGLGGIMVWESGQDCRPVEVDDEEGRRHLATCPTDRELHHVSLHAALRAELRAQLYDARGDGHTDGHIELR